MPRLSMHGECPADVLPDQRGGIVRPGAQRRQNLRRARRIAQADGEVAQPAPVGDAADGGAAHALVELRLAPAEQLDQGSRIEAVARAEIVLAAGPGEAVPRADDLAVVASVHAVADERPQLLRDGALVLYGEV